MAAVSRALAARHTTWFVLAAAAGAAGQAPADPVLAHFREYRAALERDDLPAAERAAAAALTASEAGRGPRTAILALNLANLRLELGPPYDALPPARTAHTLAAASPDSGVDTVAAALTLGRAEVKAGDAVGTQRLLAAFAAAGSSSALDTDVYNAAVALGLSASESKDYTAARSAWETAARLANATDDPTFARARALTGEGAAIFLATADGSAAPRGLLSPPDAQAANDALATAQRLLLPSALAEASGAALSASQLAYAQALAWQTALLAKVASDGTAPPRATRYGSDVPAFDDGAWCRIRTIRNDAEIVYPPQALDQYGVGAVVLHIGLDAANAVTRRTVAAAVPPGVLADAVEKAAAEWRVEKDPASRSGCRMPASAYVNVRFVLG